MRDKKTKRKNKQFEDRMLKLRKDLEDYEFKKHYTTFYCRIGDDIMQHHKYVAGYFSFFKNIDEYLEYNSFFNLCTWEIDLDPKLYKVFLDIYFQELKVNKFILINFHQYMLWEGKKNKIECKLALTFIQYLNPNYIIL
jgi:hypothetical protein